MQLININSKQFTRLFILAGLTCLAIITGCKKFVEIPLPADRITAESVFSTDKTTAAAINNILISLDGNQIVSGVGIGFKTGLYADELQDIGVPDGQSSVYAAAVKNTPYYSDEISTSDNTTGWTDLYAQVYNVNLAIEGITASSSNLIYKNQWLGECYFLRALLYYYVVNIFGDAVLTTSSDYRVNRALPRATKSEIYQQATKDLITAQGLLSAAYKDANGATTTNRTRPNKYAAFALLARIYLYAGDWANAKIQTDSVINGVISGATHYTLISSADIANTFLATSPEIIFGVASGTPLPFGTDWITYNYGEPAVLPPYPAVNSYPTVALTESLVKAFDTTDLRKKNWTRATLRPGGTDTTKTVTWYSPDKYKSQAANADLCTILRLAEIYLIRAEANAKLNNLPGAIVDLNVIRNRADLQPTTATSQQDVIKSIINERRLELFTEIGQRMFDLRRTGMLDSVMNAEVVNKQGATWSSYKQYWPIPISDIQQNVLLAQTPGY